MAVQGVFVGTSSWKYPGWCRMLYDPARYERRGKFAESRFKRDCLTEYAEVFKTVCVDAAYYTFPSQQYLEGMVAQVPEDFLFGFKVTDAIKAIAAQAKLKVSFDPRLSGTKAFPTISFRWETLTARQALAALLDNYNLAMVEDPTTANARITFKKQTADKPSSPGNNRKD